MSPSSWLSRSVRIFGRVQGVWFRESTRREAMRLGVVGWVQNRQDGAVEGEFHGPAQAVEALIAWCHQGPPMAQVSRVEEDALPVPEFPPTDFQVLQPAR